MSKVAAIFCSQFNTGYNIVLAVPGITVFVETFVEATEHKEHVTRGPREISSMPGALRSARRAVKTTTLFGTFLCFHDSRVLRF